MDENRKPILYGNKVTLRPITLEDTALIIKWRNASEVRRNFIFQETLTNEMHEYWMETKVANGEVIQYIIEDSDTGKPIGSVYFRDIDKRHNSAEYGIFIGESDARGRGIGTEVAQLFLSYGFHTLALHRISLRVLASNQIAYGCYVKAGFRYEGCFREMVCLDGKYCDVIFMAVLSEDVCR